MRNNKIFVDIAASLTIFFIVNSCTMRMPPEFLQSPSGHYNLKIDINREKSNEKYNCVLLSVCDTSYRELSTLQTSASNAIKWAVGWHPFNDTIILFSKDIGIYAYNISSEGKLVSIKVDKEIENQGEEIFKKKYATTK